jgi:hypothetical protein
MILAVPVNNNSMQGQIYLYLGKTKPSLVEVKFMQMRRRFFTFAPRPILRPRSFAEPVLSGQPRCFASLSMTVEGFRMTREGLRMTGCGAQDNSDEIIAHLVGVGLREYWGRGIGVFALFIQCGKHQMRVCRLLQCRRLGIMAVFDHR